LPFFVAAGKLQTADLDATSQAMQVHNKEVLAGLHETWQGHFKRMFDGIPPAAQQPRAQEMKFDKALKSAYGVKLSGCHDQKNAARSWG
jgi:hypothetical protein